jgi:hypothetical protein
MVSGCYKGIWWLRALWVFVIEGVGVTLKGMENSLESIGEADVEAESRDRGRTPRHPTPDSRAIRWKRLVLWGFGLLFSQYIWLCYIHVHRIIK